MDPINYYKVLQVDPEAEQEVIKAAYRALSRKYHPDGSHPSVERMVRLNDAYAVLNDPPSRARHNDDLERRDFSGGRAPSSPATSPRMRYQAIPDEPPRPRRKYRRYGIGVGTQVVVIGLCVLGVMASGILKPVQSSQPEPTPTPPSFLTTPDDLRLGFEADGFIFDTEFSRSGDPLTRGADPDEIAAVYIGENQGILTYASLLLASSDGVDTSEDSVRQQAIGRLLDSTFGSAGGRLRALDWIMSHPEVPEDSDEVIISGWLLRMWPASDTQTGIVVRPAGR